MKKKKNNAIAQKNWEAKNKVLLAKKKIAAEKEADKNAAYKKALQRQLDL